jgi:hypothetical protein
VSLVSRGDSHLRRIDDLSNSSSTLKLIALPSELEFVDALVLSDASLLHGANFASVDKCGRVHHATQTLMVGLQGHDVAVPHRIPVRPPHCFVREDLI